MADIVALIKALQVGAPRESYRAGNELASLGQASEIPLARALVETRDPRVISDILLVLQKVKVSEPAAVDAVVRRLMDEERRIRAAAASCLLHSSPKLRRFLPRIRAAFDREAHRETRTLLQKLLERYPGPPEEPV